MKNLIINGQHNQDTNCIIFYGNSTDDPILKLCENGDIFSKGKLIENDKEIVDGLREFLIKTNINKESLFTNPHYPK